MINGPRSSRIGPKLTEIRASKVEKPGKPRGFLDTGSADDAGVVRVEEGRAVTSLGSTTAIKLVSPVKIDDAATGVYSHRLDDAWLVGGASNAGCRVLRDFSYDDDELRALSLTLDPYRTNAAGVYPLARPGERFPFADPGKRPAVPARDQETPRKPGVFGLWRPLSRSHSSRFGSFLDR